MVFHSSYRTYEEWKRFTTYIRQQTFLSVLTVPMRNGNALTFTCVWLLKFSSYRTYEEWKHQALERIDIVDTSSYRTYEEWKPGTDADLSVNAEVFLPYLWGMETKRNIGNLKITIGFLPYLWGMETITARSCYGPTVAFLPYLWGMETLLWVISIQIFQLRSYRTYEEWKQQSDNHSYTDYNGFLPYLWGMETNDACGGMRTQAQCSYRTYEEWKPLVGEAGPEAVIPFLPYLWGMETLDSHRQRQQSVRSCSYRTYEEWKQIFGCSTTTWSSIVLTVPMRNGNSIRSRWFGVRSSFLPYLWGMET